jgi:hypothetical protein
MAIFEVFAQIKDFNNILLKSPGILTSGRMNSAAAEFFKLLEVFRDYFLNPKNISNNVLRFLANPENMESLGPVIERIQPKESQTEVLYRIAVALTGEIDLLIEKQKKYIQLGLNDMETLQSFQKLEKYLEEYYAKK